MDSRTPSTITWICFYLLAQSLTVLGQDTDGEVDLTKTPLMYIPNKTWALIGAGCYIFALVVCVIWSTRAWGRYMLSIMIGVGFYAAGLLLRIVYANDMTSVMKYATMNLIVLLSPCGFIAGVYMLLSRLAFHLDAVEYLVISPRWLTKIFVTSDILTFFVQATGGGLTAMDDPDKRNMGKTASLRAYMPHVSSLTNSLPQLFLGGLIAQLISFLFYTLIFGIFVYRIRSYRRNDWDGRSEGFLQHWTALVWSMIISCIAIIIRSVFRTFENAEGREGYLAVHEAYFYVLDCFVLWIAVVVFIVTWPPRYLTGYNPAWKDSRVELTSTRYGA